MSENFEFWKKEDEQNKGKTIRVIKENESSIGFDDKINLEQELIDKRFMNKEKFRLEDLPKIQQIINDLVNKDQKLVEDIQALKKGANTAIDSFKIDDTQEKLSEKDTEKFLNFVNESLSESFRRRILLESRLDISLSLMDVFDKMINTFQDAQESPENEEELEMFPLVVNAFKDQNKQAKSIYLDVKSELLEIDKMSKTANSFLKRKNVIDYLKNNNI